MSTLREWHTALQTAIQSGIPLSAGLLQPYRAQATTNLRLASIAATTTADRNAYQLLNNVYLNMGKLSDKYVNMRASHLTYIAPDALQNDRGKPPAHHCLWTFPRSYGCKWAIQRRWLLSLSIGVCRVPGTTLAITALVRNQL